MISFKSQEQLMDNFITVSLLLSTLILLLSLSTLVVQTLAVMFRETEAEAAKLHMLSAEK